MNRDKEIYTVDLIKILESYHNKWVALSPDEKKVTGNSKSPKQVLAESTKRGEKIPSLRKFLKIM
jgi:hypothetical protein